jgi:hypothetical protein
LNDPSFAEMPGNEILGQQDMQDTRHDKAEKQVWSHFGGYVPELV